jgi:hypothetical protein
VIAGALMGMRIPEHRAKQYEEGVREGNTLISVHTRNAEQFDRAMKCLATGGAEDLHEVLEPRTESHASVVPSATREMPSDKDPRQEIPSELEEAEQDAADPTHEKEIPPENQK